MFELSLHCGHCLTSCGRLAFANFRFRQDYEQHAPRALPAVAEPLLAGALTVTLLVVPRFLQAGACIAPGAAALWALLAQWAAGHGGCSLAGPLLGVFGTHGPYGHPASGAWCLLSCLLDGTFIAGTAGLGALVSAIFRLACGQTVVERLLRVTPAVELAVPARIGGTSPRPTGRSSTRVAAVTPRRL